MTLLEAGAVKDVTMKGASSVKKLMVLERVHPADSFLKDRSLFVASTIEDCAEYEPFCTEQVNISDSDVETISVQFTFAPETDIEVCCRIVPEATFTLSTAK